MGKKRKKTWNSFTLCICWSVWKERNRIAFKDGTLVVQRLKYSFVYNLWSWNTVYLGEEAYSLVGFFGVIGLELRAGGFFLCSAPFLFVLGCLVYSCILCSCLVIYVAFADKKKSYSKVAFARSLGF